MLLAGNDHVRRYIGVPRGLPPALRARSHAAGSLEISQPSRDADTAA